MNVTVPLLADAANISLTVPEGSSSDGTGVCIVECGGVDGGVMPEYAHETLVVVGAGAEGGHVERTATPPALGMPPPPGSLRSQCRRVWPAPAAGRVDGAFGGATWSAAKPGFTLFGSVDLVLPGGEYAFALSSSC